MTKPTSVHGAVTLHFPTPGWLLATLRLTWRRENASAIWQSICQSSTRRSLGKYQRQQALFLHAPRTHSCSSDIMSRAAPRWMQQLACLQSNFASTRSRASKTRPRGAMQHYNLMHALCLVLYAGRYRHGHRKCTADGSFYRILNVALVGLVPCWYHTVLTYAPAARPRRAQPSTARHVDVASLKSSI